MEASRLRVLFKNVVSYSSHIQRLRPFSSSVAAVRPKRWGFFSDDSETGSSVYRHALKFQRPSTIRWKEQFRNSVSFIGTVCRPLQIVNARDKFGVYTLLNVKTSLDSNHSFWILLKMWGEIAEVSIKHLKPYDFIYVSGHLGSYTKADKNKKLRTYYEVIVKEINYVAQQVQGRTCQKAKQSGSGDSVESSLEKYKNRLHLWQVFFTNPLEWWDDRKGKLNPKQPDFKHKDTGEALWLSPNDPPWITKQLQLCDSRLARMDLEGHKSSRSQVSPLVYDDRMVSESFKKRTQIEYGA